MKLKTINVVSIREAEELRMDALYSQYSRGYNFDPSKNMGFIISPSIIKQYAGGVFAVVNWSKNQPRTFFKPIDDDYYYSPRTVGYNSTYGYYDPNENVESYNMREAPRNLIIPIYHAPEEFSYPTLSYNYRITDLDAAIDTMPYTYFDLSVDILDHILYNDKSSRFIKIIRNMLEE